MGLLDNIERAANTDSGRLLIIAAIVAAARKRKQKLKELQDREDEIANHARANAEQNVINKQKLAKDLDAMDAIVAKADLSYNKFMKDMGWIDN